MELARVKELLRTAAYKVDYLLLECFGKMFITKKGIRKVHFSIDDVFDMVEDEHSCIRDDLHRLNTEYGLFSHLFLFFNHDGKVDGIRYLKTDIRLEKVISYQLINKPKTDTLVVFTHESKYKLVSKRLNLFCDLLYQADVEFI